MIAIHLHGALKKFGEVFKFEAFSTADALQLLLTQKADLAKEINAGKFTVKIGNVALHENELHRLSSAEESLHILPVIAGRKGIGSIVIGAALIGAAFWTGGASMAAWKFGASMLFSTGVAMTMYGASSFFFKPPTVDDQYGSQDRGKSAHFGNLGNNIAHDTIYPFGYGTWLCGSIRVSEGVIAVRNDPNEQPKDPVVGEMKELEREYFTGVAARDPNGNLYPTDFTDDSVKAQNYRII